MIINKYLPGVIVEPLVRLLKKPKYYFEFESFSFVYYDDYICFRAGLVENYEPEVFRAINSCSKRGGVFYDVGANQGIFSVSLSNKFDQIFSFECNPPMLLKLNKNIKINSIENIKVINSCVSNKLGMVDFYPSESENSGTSSLLKSVNTESNSVIALQVDSTTLDHFVFMLKNLPPSVIKIDVEGAEIDVIAGGGRVIERYKPIIVFECNNEEKLEEVVNTIPNSYEILPIYQIGVIGLIKKIFKVHPHNYIAVNSEK